MGPFGFFLELGQWEMGDERSGGWASWEDGCSDEHFWV